MANATRFEAELEAVFKAHEGMGAELKFMSTVFTFLQRRTGFFDKPSATRLTRALLKKHVDRAAAKRAEEGGGEGKGPVPATAATPAAAASPPEPRAESAPEPAPEPATDAKDAATEAKDEDKLSPGEGNGGAGTGYTWKQTLAEVTVSVPVPSHVKGKDVLVRMEPRALRVAVRGSDAPAVDGRLTKQVSPADSTWIIDRHADGTASVTLFLRKQNQVEWWAAVLEGDPEIDVARVAPESSRLGDLDPSVRGTVEKMMFDQQQKELNRPTSDEMEKQRVMERFMAEHPELDFSNAKMM